MQMNHRFKLGSKGYVDVSCDKEQGILTWNKDSPGKTPNKTNLPIKDIFAVRHEGEKWTIQFVKRTNQWLAESVTFIAATTEAGVCEEWSNYIQEAIQTCGQNRPKRLLVFINPDGGSKQGVKDYNKIAKPLFAAAGITDDVIVTEDVDHVGRVIPDYDLTSIDGIVAVGGDGTFMHVATAVMKRLMKDAGKDIDDPAEPLVKSQIKLGMLPGGTGQGLVRMFSGVPPSYTTCALQIILGETISGKLTSVHHNDKLLSYAVLQCCFGVMGSVIEKCEDKRWMGRGRYAIGLGSMLWSHLHPYEVKLSVLIDKDDSDEGSGQGLVRMFTGVHPSYPTYTTCALQIIFGGTIPGKLTSLHQNDKLVCYSTLQCCFGPLARGAEISENNRWLGRGRYLMGLGTMFWNYEQPYKLKLSFLIDKDDSDEEWVTTCGAFAGVDTFAFNYRGGPCYDYVVDRMTTLVISQNTGRWSYLKVLFTFVRGGDDVSGPHVTIYDSKAFRIDLPTIDNGNKDYHPFNIDGDVVKVGAGLLQARLHTDVFKIFGTGVVKHEDQG